MMKTLFRRSIFCIASILTLLGCQHEKDAVLATVQLSIHAPSIINSEISITTRDKSGFTDSTLAEVKLDSSGTAVIEFSLTHAVLANLNIEQLRNWHNLYITPGDELEVNFQTIDEVQKLTYSGTGSKVNNYLEQVSVIEEQHLANDGNPIFQLEKDEFIAYLDAMKDAFAAFHQGYTDTIPLPEALSTSLINKNELELVTLRQNYDLVHFMDHLQDSVLSEEISLEQPGGGNYEVPVDTTFLDNPMLANKYELALKWLLELKVNNPVALKLGRLDLEKEFPMDSLIMIVDKIIRRGDLPAGIKEFCIAVNIDSFLDIGITPGLDSIYNHFREEYPQSEYIAPIEKRYNQWLAFAPGRPAPDFTGTTMDGKKVSLSHLKGHVVYVDIWATWCGPCIQEFPYSKKLQQQFEGNEEVTFLYVSVDVDNDQEKWKDMVAEKDLEGIHIRDPSQEEHSVWQVYHLSGIPRYILVDQRGMLVNADAPRPSSSTIKDEIQGLLKNTSAL